jgi:hypothetical protein
MADPKRRIVHGARENAMQGAGLSHFVGHENERLLPKMSDSATYSEGGNRYPKTWRLGYPKWYTIDRVRPEDGELLGSLHEERKRCGKENCRCASGREEDLHGPYFYRRWRDEEGNQHKEYVPRSDVEEVRTRIQKRRLKRERKERAEWMNRGEGDGHSRDYWKRENGDGPLEKIDRLTDALNAVL